MRFGVDENLLDRMAAEAEEKKGKDIFTEAMESSVANTAANITGTADFLVGQPLESLGWEDNFISEWNSYYQDKAEEKHQDVMEAAARTGRGRTAEITGEILTFLGEAGIDALFSILTGGASTAAKLGSKGGKVLKYADDVGDAAKKKGLVDKVDIKSYNDVYKNNSIKERIEKGELSKKISIGKQKKHIEGTKEFEDYKKSRIEKGKTVQSVLKINEKEAQQLIEEIAGKGEPKITNGKELIKVEYFDADFIVGKYYKDNKYYDTKRFAVHYGKNGAHIVPVKPKGDVIK